MAFAPRGKAVARTLLAALLIIAGLRAAAAMLRPENHGMVENPCPPPEKSALLLMAKATVRILGGDDPRHDEQVNVCSYAADNAAILNEQRKVDAVFIGDSITLEWMKHQPDLFGPARINRGIGGEASWQVLARFYGDAVQLRPRVVHLMVGANDVTGFQGPTSPEAWQNNVRAMADLARANGVVLVLGTITPLGRDAKEAKALPKAQVPDLNRWLAGFARDQGAVLADYHAVLAGTDGGLKPGYADPNRADGIHLSALAYAAMRPVAERAMAQAEAMADVRAGTAQ